MQQQPYRLTVGEAHCDIQGFTNSHIQCAIDRVALLGGGEVGLSAGTFLLDDALHLRSHVYVHGRGEATILQKNSMKQTRITTFLGYGHHDLLVEEPDLLNPGEGVIVGDDNAHGFYQTSGTLIRREDDAWILDRPFAHDYRAAANGFVKTLFPAISAIDIHDAAISDLCIDGNAEENERMNACRGGGFFAHRADRIRVSRLTVRNYRGEGFGFQTCDDLYLEDCVAEDCAGNGFHPGSGSNRFHLRRVIARRNGGCGLYYCLRVRHGLLEDSLFEDNAGPGISVNSRDTDNCNRRLTLRRNGGPGIILCDAARELAAHRTVIEHCEFENNARTTADGELILQGETEGLKVIGNTLQPAPGCAGLIQGPDLITPELHHNRIDQNSPS